MNDGTQEFRRCEADSCFRRARPDSLLCDDHYRSVIENALDYARRASTDYTAAHDDRDGGHDER